MQSFESCQENVRSSPPIYGRKSRWTRTRLRALNLLKEGFEIQDVALVIERSARTVQRIKRNLQEQGEIAIHGNCGVRYERFWQHLLASGFGVITTPTAMTIEGAAGTGIPTPSTRTAERYKKQLRQHLHGNPSSRLQRGG